MSIRDIHDIGSVIYGIVGPPMLRQCGYAVFCKSYANGLKDQISKLQGVSTRVQHSVDESRAKGEYIEEDVLRWLNKVDQLIASGKQILEENKLRRFLGIIPDPKACYKLGRKAKKSFPEYEQLCSDGKFETVSYHRVNDQSLIVGSASSSKRNYVHLKSRKSVLDLVMKALDDDKINVIGIHGMGGVGKTTLLKEVENRARESNKFNGVASVFVSQNPDIMSIRAEIEYRLGRIGSDESTKTILILLDDLWKELNLNDIGVPESDTKLKIKLVMTSRNQQLLTNEMNCHPTFPLGSLNEEEGWQFFAELVSSNVKVEDWKRNPKVVELLGKCAGLPVSVEALATILKKKKKMKGSSPYTDDLLSVDELQYGKESLDGSASIEWSYNYLGDTNEEKQAKLVFRTIGLIGTPNVPILTLLKYTIGLGTFGSGIDHTIMERARREITRSLRMLQDSSLLLESNDTDHVKIHDVVGDVAVRIASRDDHAMIFGPTDGVKGWSKENLEKCTAVSLSYSAIPELPKEWKCPTMNTFIMEAQQGDCFDPNSFFKGMVKLRVIDLVHARLASFPSNQYDLQNLTTLLLHYCCLENVAAIGQLESLQVLSFIGSDIVSLPIEIGALTKLKMLDLSKCRKLESIEPGVLQKLRQLEELYLRESFDRWEAQEVVEKSNACLDELNYLPHLSTLEVRVPDTNTIPSNLPLGNLVRYKVLVGDVWEMSREYNESRFLKFKMSFDDILTEEGLILNEKWLQLTLQKIQDLHLDGLDGAWDSFHEVCNHGFEELKHLHLQNSSSIKWIIWSTEWLECSAFTTLESMFLERMKNLEKICHGLISSTCFRKLKVVKVQECDKLWNLFNFSLGQSLTELEEIEISNCKIMERIVIAERLNDVGNDEENHTTTNSGSSNNLFGCIRKRSEVSKEAVTRANHDILLSNLRCLKLRSLPKMTTFVSREAASESVNGQTIPPFFNDQEFSLPRIKDVRASAHLELGNLRQVELLDCNKIVHFINSRMLLKLQNLESLSIAKCDALEDIFDLEGIDTKGGDVGILPKLNELKLRGLPRLEHIWKKNSKRTKGCKKLRTLEIKQCHNLLYLCCSSMCQGMESLTEINIVLCDKMEKLFMEEEGLRDDSFILPSLKILGVLKCPNLKEFLSGNCQISSSGAASVESSIALQSNNQAVTRWCCGTQEPIQEDTNNTFFNQKVSLPSLEKLVLFEAVNLKELWGCDVPDQSYCNLEFVHLNRCENLSTVFPATLIERLQKLKQLVISNCEMLKSVFNLDFDWKVGEKPKALMLSQLEEVKLSWLEQLTHIVMQRVSDDEIVVGFPNLKHLEVNECSKLIDLIITTATATTLLKLETLYIEGSRHLQEIIHGEVGDMNKRNVISFPRLTSLTISHLNSLTQFSSISYLVDFKCLKCLRIWSCSDFKTMVNPRSEIRQGSLDDEDADTISLFNDKVELPHLEELDVDIFHVEALWWNEPRPGSFCKLKRLSIILCQKLQYIFPSLMIKRLQNLDHISIRSCDSLQDIFKVPSTQPVHTQDPVLLDRHIIDVEKNIGGNRLEETGRTTIRLTKLTCLELAYINLSSVWLGSYTLELPSLKRLTSTEAAGVLQAILQKVNLPNLEALEIYYEQVEELWHSGPPAESFYRLKFLQVESCQELKKIFPSFMLKRLQNLEKLVVKGCKSLKIVFELEDVVGEISEPPAESFYRLKFLEVEWCQELKKIFPSFMLKRLQNLEKLVVKDCNSLQTVFEFEDVVGEISEYGEATSDDSTDHRIIALPRLMSLTLEGLRNLIHLFGQRQGTYTLELLSLKEFLLVESGEKEAITQKVVFPDELQVKMYHFFGSKATIEIDLMKALQNDNQVIGLLGYMNQDGIDVILQRENEEQVPFNQVCRLFYPDGDYIQEALGAVFSIIYSEPGERGRAQCLRKILLSNQDIRLILILDRLKEEKFDLEEEFDLEDIGIPYKQLDPKLFKIILMDWNKDRLDKMGAQEIINIGTWVEGRWQIFDSLKQSRSMAEELADECGSDDLARILKEKLLMRDSEACKDALQRLRESAYEYEARKRVIDSLNYPKKSEIDEDSEVDEDEDEDEDEEREVDEDEQM